MNRTILLSAFWIASLAVVFLLGRSLAPSTSSDHHSSAEPQKMVEERVVRTVEFIQQDGFDEDDDTSITTLESGAFDGPDRGDRHGRSASGASFVTDGQIREMLPSALNSDDRITQNLIVAHMLSQLTAENAGSMLAAFESSDRNWNTDQHFRMFMHAWAQVDGRAAAEYAWLNKEGRKVGYGGTWALSAWAENDPAGAYDFMKDQDEGLANKMHDGFLRGYARANITEASDYVADMASGKMRGAAVETLLREHMRAGGRGGTLDWATQTLNREITSKEDESYVKYVLAKATMEAGKDNGVDLARWVDQHRDSKYLTSQMFEEAADEWAESNPSAAMAWLERHMDDKRVNSKVIDEVTDEWAKTDPNRAAAWIDANLDSPHMTATVSGRAAGEWAAKDPQAAAEWAASLPRELQGKTNVYVARQWPNDKIDQAVEWVDASRDPGLDSAREAIADRIDGKDPAEAIRLANSITDPKVRERSLVRSAQAMARQNKEAVIAWLPVSGLSSDAQRKVLGSRDRDRR